MPLTAVPAASESVVDVEWSASGEGSEESSGNELLDHEVELDEHSHSDLLSEDAVENQEEAVADHESFESWGTKEDGSEFSEIGSGDLRAAADATDDKKEKKRKTKEEGEEADSSVSGSDASKEAEGDAETDGKAQPDVETKVSGDEAPKDLGGDLEAAATTEPGAGVGDLEEDAPPTSKDASAEDPLLTPGDEPADDGALTARKPVINEDANEETKVDVEDDLEDTMFADEEKDGGDLRSKMRRHMGKSKSKLLDVSSAFKDRHPLKCRCAKCACLMVVLPVIILFLFLQLARCTCARLFGCCHCREEVKEEVEEVVEVVENRGPERSRLKKKHLFDLPDKRASSDIDLGDLSPTGTDRSPMSSPRSPRSPGSPSASASARRAIRQSRSMKSKQPQKKERAKAKGAAIMEGEVVSAYAQKMKAAKQKPWWTHWRLLLHPEKLPRYLRKRWHDRTKWIQKIGTVLDKIEEEEAFDWDVLDEEGNPTPASFWCPKCFRRKSRFFMLVYWDPFLDLLSMVPEFHVIAKWILRLFPLVGFFLACGWFSWSLYRNFQYKEGDCTVEKLPQAYETVGLVIEEVEAVYIVRRHYQATPERGKGSKVQECKATVSCGEMDYAESNAGEKARCVEFKSWELGDAIECYYHKDDFWGDDNQELFCLSLPSKLEREMFTLGVSFILVCLSCFITGLIQWRKNDLKRQSALAQKESERQEKEAEAAKKRIEEKEFEDAKKRAKAANLEEGIDDADENVGEFKFNLADDDN